MGSSVQRGKRVVRRKRIDGVRPWLVWPVRPLRQRTFATEEAARAFVKANPLYQRTKAVVIKVVRWAS